MAGRIIAGALGNCVHVAGVVNFLKIAEELGYETIFLGAAIPVEDFIEAIRRYQPDLVGVSYRLSPETAAKLLDEFRAGLAPNDIAERRFAFGGTPPICRIGEQSGLFARCFDGLEQISDVRAFLGESSVTSKRKDVGDSLLSRIDAFRPVPLLRHHLGLSAFEETLDAVRAISESGVLDIISLAPDQNAQESLFRPEEMNALLDGAGGVPVRTQEDLIRLKAASRTGNYPLMRIYGGTRDLVQWAELATNTIGNAWGAIPLCWYDTLDGRSKRVPEEAIRENQQAMRWYAERHLPLEVNESHHWSLRDAHDTIAVAMAYLAARNAKAMGVSHYVSQYMLNTPPMTSTAMDLAKMQAKIELIESLHDASFTTFRQVRAGLLHFSPRMNIAKGQLAASTAAALQLKPHIIHVVGFCEGDHAANAGDIIESCEIVQGVLKNCRVGLPDAMADPLVIKRKTELVKEARMLIEAIRSLGEEDGEDGDPLTNPRVLSLAIQIGLIDAPHLKGNPHAAGLLETRCVEGAIHAWDRDGQRVIREEERISGLLARRPGPVFQRTLPSRFKS